jgi:hypothetical protein
VIDDKAVEDFLEHFGVKGMRWGHRKRRDEVARAKQFGGRGLRKAPRGDFRSRKLTEKAALVGGGYVGFRLTKEVTNKILGSKVPFAQLAIEGAGAIAGARAVRHILDRSNAVLLSDLSKPK